MAKILLIEDDLDLCKMIATRLCAESHVVETAHDGKTGFDYMTLTSYEIIVLDWNLPIMTGVEVLTEFRKRGGQTPVIFLTGKDQDTDIEKGLDCGADDYLTKPFSIKVLSARIRALLRRPASTLDNLLKYGDLEMDTIAHRLTRGGIDVRLQPRDFTLLEFLMRNPDRIFSAGALLERVWHADSDASLDGLRASIKRIRKAVDRSDLENDSVIETVARVGYRLKKA